MLLSIVIPAYNVEEYISDCLDSIFLQNVDFSLIEVIVVNDGSQDNTLEIIENYNKKNKYNFKYYTQINQGCLKTRINGLRYAMGEYIWFIDADDVIDKNSLKYIIEIIQLKKYDLIKFSLESFPDNFISRKFYNDNEEFKIIHNNSDDFYKKNILESNIYNNLANEIVRKSLFENIEFSSISQGEDLLLNLQLVDRASVIYLTNRVLYYYRINKNSVTNIANENRLYQNIIDISVVYSSKLFFTKKWGFDKLCVHIKNQLLDFIQRHLFKLCKMNCTNIFIKKNIDYVLDCKIFNDILGDFKSNFLISNSFLKKIFKLLIIKKNRNILLMFCICLKNFYILEKKVKQNA